MRIILSNGDLITTRKPHACGGRTWLVIRTGADVKIKCAQCGHVVMTTAEKASRFAIKVERTDGTTAT
ncbi:MAG: DUF951 domain-containing protein [Clostridiales bacterium]|nr:DUF951 domain-containing protein [Clostridiales bacterium]